jgi:tRNA(Ile)-lysidine synthase
MDQCIAHIHAYIENHGLLPPKSRVLLGLSGGPDSLFLLHVLADMRVTHDLVLIAAHLDHEWRQESAQDAIFCTEICAQLGVPYVTKKISELGITLKTNGSKEEHARRMRRHFFEQIKQEHALDCIVLAHHAQDQQETFFMRLMRGATISGLVAMRPRQVDRNATYVRPLLETDKAAILNYLHTHSIAYLTDPSNSSPAYLRNRIRHQVLPVLQQTDSRFEANFQRTLLSLQETERFLEQLTDTVFAQITESMCASLGDGVRDKRKLNIILFAEQQEFMRLRIIMRLLISAQVPFTPTTSFLREIDGFLTHAGSKTHAIHDTWCIVKKQPWAYIER